MAAANASRPAASARFTCDSLLVANPATLYLPLLVLAFVERRLGMSVNLLLFQ